MKLSLNAIRSDLKKKHKDISFGFKNPSVWLDSGNYALNYRMTRSFTHGYPLGKVTILAGDPAAGKSFLAASAIRDAQKQGITTIIFDSEEAMDEDWLNAAGVPTRKTEDECNEKEFKEFKSSGELPKRDDIERIPVTLINDVAAYISSIMTSYKAQVEGVPEDERSKLLFVIDSLGALQTPISVNQFESGDMKGDMGWKPRQLKALILNCVTMFGLYDVGMICTNHTYGSQDMFKPDAVVAGGTGPIYAASIVVGLTPFKNKVDTDGNKTTDILGIRSKARMIKSRFSQSSKEANMKIFWKTGLDKHSGLFELFSDLKVIDKPSGNKWIYTDKAGTEHKYFEKGFIANTNGILDLIMAEFDPVENIIENMDDELDEDVLIDDFLEEEAKRTESNG